MAVLKFHQALQKVQPFSAGVASKAIGPCSSKVRGSCSFGTYMYLPFMVEQPSNCDMAVSKTKWKQIANYTMRLIGQWRETLNFAYMTGWIHKDMALDINGGVLVTKSMLVN